MSNSQKRRTGSDPVAAARAGQRSAAAMRIWVVSAVLALAVVVGVIIAVNRSGSDAPAASDSGVSMPTSVLGDDGITMSLSGAKVKVELWVDLQCPACKAYEERVDAALEQAVADGTVELVVHPIAILDQMSTTQYSTRAGSAVVCAATEGKFWPYSKLLFTHQPAEGSAGLTDKALIDYGAEVGLTSDTFATCVGSQAQSDWIASSTKAATESGVTGTPTITVNGEKLTSGTLEELQSAITSGT